MRRIAVAAALLLAGCPEPPKDTGRMPPPLDTTYAGDAAGLTSLWRDILKASIHDERERVHTLMASFIMSDDDLVAVFGDEKGRWLQPRYLPMISTLVNQGSMELVAQISDRKYDDVEVFAIDEKGTDVDQALLAALKVKQPVYSVRVKKKGEARGLRYDGFLYRNGHWVTTNQLAAKYLVTPKDGGVAAPAPVTPPTVTMGSAKRDGGK
jgi:hypothetical protein